MYVAVISLYIVGHLKKMTVARFILSMCLCAKFKRNTSTDVSERMF